MCRCGNSCVGPATDIAHPKATAAYSLLYQGAAGPSASAPVQSLCQDADKERSCSDASSAITDDGRLESPKNASENRLRARTNCLRPELVEIVNNDSLAAYVYNNTPLFLQHII
jgi:hypothetical protein